MSCTELAIRQAAVDIIARHGYESMTLRGLAAHAGVNTTTFYVYFKGKQELVGSLIMEYYEQLQDAWQLARPALSSARLSWMAFVRSHVVYHLGNPLHIKLASLDLNCLQDAAHEEALQSRTQYIDEIRDIIERGVAKADFECPDPDRYSYLLFDLMTQSSGWYFCAEDSSVDEIVGNYLRITSKLLEPTLPRRSLRTACSRVNSTDPLTSRSFA